MGGTFDLPILWGIACRRVHRINPAMLARGDLSVLFTNLLHFSLCLDTFVERNTLMERVYPRLKSYCQERGYDFQVVDMRWGVRDESTDDHMTTELCMREIRACQKLSTGPNFIVSLFDKRITFLYFMIVDYILLSYFFTDLFGTKIWLPSLSSEDNRI